MCTEEGGEAGWGDGDDAAVYRRLPAPVWPAKQDPAQIGHQSHRNPYASPLWCESLDGICPLLLTVGDAEGMRDETVEFAKKVKAAGREVICDVWPRLFHDFPNYGCPGLVQGSLSRLRSRSTKPLSFLSPRQAERVLVKRRSSFIWTHSETWQDHITEMEASFHKTGQAGYQIEAQQAIRIRDSLVENGFLTPLVRERGHSV